MDTREPDVPIPGDDPVAYLDKEGLRRERERLGAGPLGVALLLLLVGGIPLMYGVHASLFPRSTAAKQLGTYASLEEVPVLFDPVTEESMVRYCGDPEGEVEFVGRDVAFSPVTGEPCRPLTRAVLRTFREAESRRSEKAEAARMAKETEEARRVAEEVRLDAERQRERQREQALRSEQAFRDRYVNRSAVGQLAGGHVTVAVSDTGLERSIAQALRDRGISASTNVLTDHVFESEVFSKLVAGDRGLFDRLQLGDGRATLLLGEVDLEPAARTGVGNTVHAKGRLTIHLVPLPGGPPVSLPTVSAVGAGFTEEQARMALNERLLEVLLARSEIGQLTP